MKKCRIAKKNYCREKLSRLLILEEKIRVGLFIIRRKLVLVDGLITRT